MLRIMSCLTGLAMAVAMGLGPAPADDLPAELQIYGGIDNDSVAPVRPKPEITARASQKITFTSEHQPGTIIIRTAARSEEHTSELQSQ